LLPRQGVGLSVVEKYLLSLFDWLASEEHNQPRLLCNVFSDSGVADRRGKMVDKACRVSEEEGIDN